ncbi:hypothetical protein BV22DRAFT_919580 [Leucogyrophana mollusca]|uniref:Uncharacterized protein n=1 Tax=Leucogyrophana mollusca TaxID=85980 RepID=A0ACB8AXN8_9AGAM|nr:hypothetical protein BV22DRAFT_919580 [Leucogyrophana mollusca]
MQARHRHLRARSVSYVLCRMPRDRLSFHLSSFRHESRSTPVSHVLSPFCCNPRRSVDMSYFRFCCRSRQSGARPTIPPTRQSDWPCDTHYGDWISNIQHSTMYLANSGLEFYHIFARCTVMIISSIPSTIFRQSSRAVKSGLIGLALSWRRMRRRLLPCD